MPVKTELAADVIKQTQAASLNAILIRDQNVCADDMAVLSPGLTVLSLGIRLLATSCEITSQFHICFKIKDVLYAVVLERIMWIAVCTLFLLFKTKRLKQHIIS